MSDLASGDILCVDDTPANLQVLSQMLKEAGYKVRAAPNGMAALRAIEHAVPDLILLDINMPDMNGYEMCERLKTDKRNADVPVIFLSALSDTEDKVRAFGAGGVDYVTKPFQFEEVMARVETHLRLARLTKELASRYDDLKAAEEMKDSLTHMIVHDLRSPLAGIVSALQLLEMDADTMKPESAEDVQLALQSSRSLMQMITSLLDVNKMESGQMELRAQEGDVAAAVDAAVDSLAALVRDRDVVVEGSATARYDLDLITRVVANLLGNALKFTPKTGQIRLTVSGGPSARVEVVDQGRGVSDQHREKIFEKFGQVEASTEGARLPSTGLGLTFCKLAVEAHGGRIGVESEPGEGSTFWFELPRT